MIPIEPDIFHAAFDFIETPALLRRQSEWVLNPAAQEAAVPQIVLEQLKDLETAGIFWFNHRFYRATVTSAGPDAVILLQPDSFHSQSGRAVANQLREHLTAAFDPIIDLAECDEVRESASAQEAVSRLNNALFRILRLVRQLDLSADDDPMFCGKLQFTDLVSLLKRFHQEVAPLCAQAGVTLEIQTESELSTARVDQEMIEQLFLQLVSNSLKAVQPGGTISIRMKEQGSNAIFTFTDSGGGLSAHSINDPLWGRPEEILLKRGLGLGLPIAQRIAAAHGGSLVLVADEKQPQLVLSLPLDRSELLLQSPKFHFESYAGFSPAKVALADSLPAQVYSPFLPAEEDE